MKNEAPCCLLLFFFSLFADPFGKTDEREPLTNAVRSDSAIIGGKSFLLLKAERTPMIPYLEEIYLIPSLIMAIQHPEPSMICETGRETFRE